MTSDCFAWEKEMQGFKKTVIINAVKARPDFKLMKTTCN
jgi:hypothetical protein